MKIKEFAEARNLVPGKVVDEFRKNFPGQKWSVDSELPPEFLAQSQQYEEVDSHRQEPIGVVNEAPITKVDEAFNAAAYKLTEAERATQDKAIEVREAQSELIGEAVGAKDALTFVRCYIRGKQAILDEFTKQTIQSTDTLLDSIDTEVFKLAEEAAEALGKSIRQKELTTQKLKELRSRVAGLSKIKS